MTPTSTPGLGRSANRRPRIVALPDVGVVRPTIIRIEVDLPAPFGPRKPVTRPLGHEADVVDDGLPAVRLRQGVDGDHGRTFPSGHDRLWRFTDCSFAVVDLDASTLGT